MLSLAEAKKSELGQWMLITMLITLSLLVGCASHPQSVSVKDLGGKHDRRLKTHVVAAGETLYSIAWRYDLNFERLAEVNGIDASYRIVPGQQLSLEMDKRFSASPPRPSRAVKPTAPSTPPSRSSLSTRSVKQSNSVTKAPEPQSSGKTLRWFWPTDGQVIKKFFADNGRHKGIDLGGKVGQPVLAASPGVVVYAGSGLRGYGKLIIIKHNDEFLSAYAHNRKLLAKEGEQVSSGQQIAEMGSSGTESVKLHFEIRFDGQPVDPLKYLPPRSRE